MQYTGRENNKGDNGGEARCEPTPGDSAHAYALSFTHLVVSCSSDRGKEHSLNRTCQHFLFLCNYADANSLFYSDLYAKI